MESILSYRKNIEEEKKIVFAEIQKSYLNQQEVLVELKEKLKKINTRLISNTPMETVERKNLDHYRELLWNRIEKQEQLLLEIEEDLKTKRSQMTEAQMDRKIMEKHRENSFTNYLLDINRKEQKNIDEYAVNSYFRK